MSRATEMTTPASQTDAVEQIPHWIDTRRDGPEPGVTEKSVAPVFVLG